uniref:Thioredoxin domain-containing protein n=1 Tax=Macrostomum lignano TaxID=282301 RepID=A0A1I8IED4_9PLAT
MIEELTNKNFRSVIGQPNRSVLVKYYHPKCAACRPAGQAFRDSAQAFSGRRDQLAFCAMDVSANACPAGIYVPGTPYIQLYIRGTRGGARIWASSTRTRLIASSRLSSV